MENKVSSVDVLRDQIDKDLAATPVDSGNVIEFPPLASYEELAEAGFSTTDIANSKRFAGQHGDIVKFTIERGWFVWDGKRWAPDEKGIQVQELGKRTAISIFGEIALAKNQREMFKHARDSQSKGAVQAMTTLARSEPGVPARLTNFDRNGWLFNVQNGTLNLKTGELQPHSKGDLLTSLSAAAFDPEADCELWDAFIWRVTAQNEELYNYLRRLVGYLLVGDTSDQSLHFLYGLGANGKSVFCEVLIKLLGEYAIAVSPDLIMQRRHGGIPNDVARLRGVRAALMNETSQGSRFDEAKLKDLTGGDTLTARFLHQEFFDFAPTHRIIIRGNYKPAITGTDEGIWRRLRLIPFTVSIPPDEQDKDLQNKLTAELNGILNWALKGCQEWQKGGLAPPEIVTEAVRKYREESDTLGRFISENCTVRGNSQVKASVLYQRYSEFAEAATERAIPQRDMPTEMERRGFIYKRTKSGRLYEGVELNSSAEASNYDY